MPKKKKNKQAITQEEVIQSLLDSITASTPNNSPTNFEIPKDFLVKLSEFSNGGFILFTFDDSGSPRCYQQFDDDKCNLAMSNFLSKYSTCIENIQGNVIMNNIMKSAENDENDDSNDTGIKG